MADASYFHLAAIATHLREELAAKRTILIYAYNGTGKTRLSGAFKDLGKKVNDDGETIERETLYFNAFTEDLFNWDNDLTEDRHRTLKLNVDSAFFKGLQTMEMDTRIRPLLDRYADFDFRIDTEADDQGRLTRAEVVFFREEAANTPTDGEAEEPFGIKVSRGEEHIFIWCFFIAIVQLVLDGAGAYKWVKYIYIDDPISSLDDNNVVMVAHHLAQMLKDTPERLRVVVSSHHVLFFNVLCNEMKKSRKYFLTREPRGRGFTVRETDSTPFLYHLASLVELHEAQKSGVVYTHHFNMLRRVMEQTASFFGFATWDECIKPEADDPNGTGYKRVIDIMNHGDYSLYEPREMMLENKDHFRRVLKQFITLHPFSPALFP